jgi:LuxR family maltose regulon positive regulatory protein
MQRFISHGEPMARLLRQVAERGTYEEYVARLLAAYGPQNQEQDSDRRESDLKPALLSQRELQVLELIATGMTNREIAAELCIAVGTVKGHTNKIYGKLDVHTRTRAVARARELGLL